MGEAKRRGTFEQRKAEAIAAGRIKLNDKQSLLDFIRRKQMDAAKAKEIK